MTRALRLILGALVVIGGACVVALVFGLVVGLVTSTGAWAQSGTVTARSQAALPTLSSGPNPLFQSLSGGLFVQPIFGTTLVDGTHGLPVNVVAGGGSISTVSAPIAPGTATATQSLVVGSQYNSTQATFTNGQQGALQISSRGALLVATGADSFSVAQATAASLNATIVGTGTFAAQATLPTTPAIASGSGVVIAPSSAAAAGLAPVASTAAESNHVLKSGAGNLYSLMTTVGATAGYLMIFDATSLPSNGAVTPKYCYPLTSNGTFGGTTLTWAPGPPATFATGITAGFSTTGCATLTASATAFFYGQVD